MSKTPVEEILERARMRAQRLGLNYFGALTPSEAFELLQTDVGARLVDVRTRAEWEWVGRIPGAIELEWNSYPGGQRNPVFAEELAALTPEREPPILFICRSGARSSAAAGLATAAGYRCAINVLEGFEGDRDAAGHRGQVGGWKKAGLPWVQG